MLYVKQDFNNHKIFMVTLLHNNIHFIIINILSIMDVFINFFMIFW